MKVVCEWCQKVILSVERKHETNHHIGPGICNECHRKVLREGSREEKIKVFQLLASQLYRVYDQ